MLPLSTLRRRYQPSENISSYSSETEEVDETFINNVVTIYEDLLCLKQKFYDIIDVEKISTVGNNTLEIAKGRDRRIALN